MSSKTEKKIKTGEKQHCIELQSSTLRTLIYTKPKAQKSAYKQKQLAFQEVN